MVEPNVKIELASSLDQARARLASSAEALRHDLDVPNHIKRSFHDHKTAYIGGATLFGLVLSKLPARRKKIYVERKSKDTVREAEKAGLWLVILQLLFKVFRPVLTSFVSEQVTHFLKSRSHGET